LIRALKEETRSATTGLRTARLRDFLVVLEIALSLVLLTGASFLAKSFVRLLGVERGFRSDHVLTAQIDLPATRYFDAERQADFYQHVLRTLDGLGGVRVAGAMTNLPLTGDWRQGNFSIEGRALERQFADRVSVSPGAFSAMGMSLLQGRFFRDGDTKDVPLVAIVNQTMARRFFSGQAAVGKRLKFGDASDPTPWRAIVGVVGDIKSRALDLDARPQIYVPYQQEPRAAMTLIIQSMVEPNSLGPAVRNAIWEMDRNQPVSQVKTMDEVVSSSMSQRRFGMVLLGAFAVTATILAALGIYTLLSYSVGQKIAEFGIRMTLGARSQDVLRLVFMQTGALVAAGLTIGVALSYGLARFLSSVSSTLGTIDLWTLAGVAATLSGVAVFASFLPALRATRIDPAMLLRQH
jgi:putative ABC transport system permease protein